MDFADKAKELIEEVAHAAVEAADSVIEKATPYAHSAAGKVNEFAEVAGEKLSDAKNAIIDAGSKVAGKGKDAIGH